MTTTDSLEDFYTEERARIYERQTGGQYVEPNRNDAENCDACFVVDTLCDYHDGVVAGAGAVRGLILMTLDADV